MGVVLFPWNTLGESSVCDVCVCQFAPPPVSISCKRAANVPVFGAMDARLRNDVEYMDFPESMIQKVDGSYWESFPNLIFVNFDKADCVETSFPRTVLSNAKVCQKVS